MTNIVGPKKKSLGERLSKDLKRNWILYLMVIPVIAYFVIFHYWPMYGVTLAFKDFSIKKGILGSPWAGLEHFERFIRGYNFKSLVANTLGISLYSLVIGFPIPIIFALLLNHMRHEKLKKAVQMVSYAPHFISTVVICNMITIFLAPDTGMLNLLREAFGLESLSFLAEPKWFKTIYVISGVWQDMGWSAIIYISALAGVDHQIHEAAIMDGANKLQRIRHIDLPSILPTIAMLLILRMGSLMSVGFEKVFLLQNSLNKPSSSIISTYVYEMGLLNFDYSFSTAVGLFNTVINFVLLIAANTVSKKVLKESLF